MKLSIFLVAAFAVCGLAFPQGKYMDWPSEVVTLPHHHRHHRYHHKVPVGEVVIQDQVVEDVVTYKDAGHIEYLDQLEVPSPDVVVVEEHVAPHHGHAQIMNVLRRTGHAVKHVGEVLANDGPFGRGYYLGYEHGTVNGPLATASTTVNVGMPAPAPVPAPVIVREIVAPVQEEVIVKEVAVPEPVYVQHRHHEVIVEEEPEVQIIYEPAPEPVYIHHQQPIVEKVIIEEEPCEEVAPVIVHHRQPKKIVVSEPAPEPVYIRRPAPVVEKVVISEPAPEPMYYHHHQAPVHQVIVEEEEKVVVHHPQRKIVVEEEPQKIVKHIARPAPRPVHVVKQHQPHYRTVLPEPIAISEPLHHWAKW